MEVDKGYTICSNFNVWSLLIVPLQAISGYLRICFFIGSALNTNIQTDIVTLCHRNNTCGVCITDAVIPVDTVIDIS